jgi:SpoVK/Ycf46/Vps4 family AAA+-type ATPase
MKKCPVCNNKVDIKKDDFCPYCNWELALIIPNGTSSALKHHNPWDLLEKFDGIDKIKEKFEKQVTYLKENRKLNLKMRQHMVFKGLPWTGKISIASDFGKILKEEGLLEIGHLNEVTVGALIGQYVGETRIKTQAVCDNAIGGILFIDEAYDLFKPQHIHKSNFRKEAIDILIEFMENNNDSIVILAGYQNEIDELLRDGNTGLSSLIDKNNHYVFEEYDAQILLKIAEKVFEKNDLKLSKDTKQYIEKNIIKKHNKSNTLTWSNVRVAVKIIEKILSNYYFSNNNKQIINEKQISVEMMSLIRENRVIEVNQRKEISNPTKATRNTIKKESKSSHISIDIRSTTKYLELHKLVGLNSVKETIEFIIESIELKRHQHQTGEITAIVANDLHLVFAGSLGTGKTTVARLYGQILKNMGILSRGNVIEVDKSKLVGQYIGHTEQKVSQVLDSAVGNVLYIDEAYQLANSRYVNTNNYGKVAIDLVIQKMTDDRGKFVVILAGNTPVQMSDFLDVIPGLKARFRHFIEFQNYSNAELLEILNKFCETNCHTIDDQCLKLTANYLKILKKREGKSFGNGREVRKLYIEVVTQQKKRLNIKRKQGTLKPDESKFLIENDFLDAIKKLNKDISIEEEN